MAAPPQTSINENQLVAIRRATPADAEVCGRIGFDAFTTLANKHNFPPDFPAPEHSGTIGLYNEPAGAYLPSILY